ncbi:MAG: CoA pyrophosphatase [Planctomycetia bacterium]|nr:CoA pyrophosphatase [Planctomycetia bacterium]
MTPSSDYLERLRSRLERPLPGRSAQALFEPELAYGRHFGPPPHDARRAAVLILVYPHDGAWHLALTKRRDDLPAHPGQVSLPGGYVEADETTKSAALRELEEELNVPQSSVEVLGNLSPLYIFGTHFYVIPWVAGCDHRPAFLPNVAEVGELFEVPIAYITDPANRGTHPRVVRGIRQAVPHFDWRLDSQVERIWGATAMILSEFLAVHDDANVDDSKHDSKECTA